LKNLLVLIYSDELEIMWLPVQIFVFHFPTNEAPRFFLEKFNLQIMRFRGQAVEFEL